MAEDSPRDCQLYLISPETLEVSSFAPKLEDALAAGGDRVGAFQLRLPGADDATITAAANALRPICNAYGVAFFLNDCVGLVTPLQADGIHLERSRKTIAEVRKAVGDEVVVGVSCGDSRDRAMQVGNDGADYVSFSIVSCQKTDAAEAGESLLSWWQDYFLLPCVAAGGVTLENAGALVHAGADFLAVRGGVWDHPAGAGEAVKAFDAAITQALQSA